MAKDSDKKGPVSPWLAGVSGVSGIVPPGRRLSSPTERRATRWSASGVRGVTPPGSQAPGEGPSAEWAKREADKKAKLLKQNQRVLDAKKKEAPKVKKPAAPDAAEDAFDPMRPMAGFVPDAFADVRDPENLTAFLKAISDFLAEHRANPECAEHFAQIITQSHAPYEILVGFTVLTALIGKSQPLRRRYGIPLERGAKVFYNLAQRLDPEVKVPRGLVPETVDALFYDLPATAYELPYAFATDAFLRMVDLLRLHADEEYEELVAELAFSLHRRFIETRAFGDRGLSELFPWEPPEWMPVG